jgi:hypothetical protein
MRGDALIVLPTAHRIRYTALNGPQGRNLAGILDKCRSGGVPPGPGFDRRRKD